MSFLFKYFFYVLYMEELSIKYLLYIVITLLLTILSLIDMTICIIYIICSSIILAVLYYKIHIYKTKDITTINDYRLEQLSEYATNILYTNINMSYEQFCEYLHLYIDEYKIQVSASHLKSLYKDTLKTIV